MTLWLSQVAAEAARLFVILGIAVQFLAGTKSNVEECKIERRHEDVYVTALYEHYPAMSGCISQEQTPTLQEVHAVIIRSTRATSLRTTRITSGHENAVDVFIKHNSHHTGSENTVFVLASALPTIWKIYSEKISNISLGLFLVSSHSRIDHGRRTKFKTKKMDLPTDPQQLAKRIRKKWSALTTLLAVEIATVVNLRVGIDSSAKEKCEIVPYLPNVYASHVEEQETRGCLVPRNEGWDGRDVHIIELVSPIVDYVNNTRYDVHLHVRTKTRPVASRHVVVVLKSLVPVHWRVTTHGLRGILDIITDQSVDSNGTNTQSFRVAVETLTAYTGSSLVSWTSDKYGLPVSYTEAQLANRFDLIVDDSDRLPNSRSSHEQLALMSDVEAGQSKHNLHDSVTNITSDLKRMIIKALLMSCEGDLIILAFQKRALKYHNVLPTQLTFSDVSCAAKDNGTHYILSTKKRACGTVVVTSHDTITYRTGIVVQWGLRSSAVVSHRNTSSSYFDGGDVNPLDDISVTINISCDSRLDKPGVVVPTASNDVQLQLKLFRDNLFHDEVLAFPAKISNQEIVYVQANVLKDDCMRVNITNCLLEFDYPSRNKFPEEHLLIANGCILDDDSSRWIDVDSEAGVKSQRFEFRFQQIWNISYNTTLQCKLAICTICSDRIVSGVPMCRPKYPCGHPDSSSYFSQTVKSISKGPLEFLVPSTGTILGTTPATAQDHQIKVVTDEEPTVDRSQNCRQIVRVEGLSTEMVVSIAFTAFIIGILLMASLWCIYVRTGPAKLKTKAGIRSVSTSGDSTPSSTAPLTIHPATAHRR